jgi:glycosyltransferase involved in cell wall biosynthesis
MRILIVSDWFAEKMGYAENFLPKALAALGAEVHVVTSNAQPYFNSPSYKETYEPFIGPGVVDCGTKEINGYTLHRLPHSYFQGKLRIKGLLQCVRNIRPQVIQTFDLTCPSTYELTLAGPILGSKLFHEQHIHASVFPPARQWKGIRNRFDWLVYAATTGRLISLLSEKCYPISTDCADIAVQFFGYQSHKISICSLGVDTDLFKQADDEVSQKARSELRERLGFKPNEIVCIYTGRLTRDKGPLLLAEAVSALIAQGQPFRSLFVGSGQQSDVDAIKSNLGSVVHPFVPVQELPQFYRVADIGVWPKQESTSQLDAAASGLPIIVSDQVKVQERIQGNGLQYEEGNFQHLAQQILKLSDPAVRKYMGELGAKKMRENFSWQRIAEDRIRDYKDALKRSGAV